MALDGIVIADIVHDMREKLVGGRILKIQQPEKDELIITVKNYDQYRLFISADASLPLIYLASGKKEAPMTAPNFCMLLRKHIGTAKIVDIYQPEFERVVVFDLEHLDEMGDLCRKKLIVEIMGKHSNIIFTDENNTIIDSIKHISAAVSSVREVLPGRDYFITKTLEKYNPLEISEEVFIEKICGTPQALTKAVYMNLTGFSPVMANELIFRAGLEPETNASELTPDIAVHLFRCFERMMDDVKNGVFSPCIVYKCGSEAEEREPVEFAALPLSVYSGNSGMEQVDYPDISSVLEEYYAKKNLMTRMKQKSTDLRHLVGNAVERAVKKYDLQKKQLEDTQKRDKFKLYGELLTTFGYGVEEGAKEVTVNNYYTNEDITIPLDEQLSAIDNAKKYYDRYSKLKRTFDAVSVQLEQTEEELEHLDSIKVALDIATCDEDLNAIKNELIEFGYIKGHFGKLKGPAPKNGKNGKAGKNGYGGGSREKSRPFHYVTEDGFHIYVGKNNYQNDELTFKFANGGDWWFHAKKNAGSHVIVKTEGKELPDRVYEQAAALAAYYSKAKDGQKVDVDYLERKNVKKPNGAKPGFVVYYTNYSMTVKPGIQGLTLV